VQQAIAEAVPESGWGVEDGVIGPRCSTGAGRLRSLGRWFRGEPGQGLAEYALILGLVVLVAVAAMTTLGSSTIQGLVNSAAAL
jgi:Flp pilus assembly pilin Flp